MQKTPNMYLSSSHTQHLALNVHGQLKRSVDVAHSRIYIVIAAIMCCYLMVMVRMVDLSLFSHNSTTAIRYDQAKPVLTKRADITDRNGMLLATDIETDSLYANPKEIRNPEQIAKQLAPFLPNISEKSLLKRLKKPRSFVWLKRNLHPKNVLNINNLGIAGVYFQKEWRRSYLYKDMFTHSIGRVNVDGKGISGLESALNSVLAQETAPLSLTLDARVQHAVQDVLAAQQRKHRAKAAVGIVMDVDTGAIIAMVSSPSFNANTQPPAEELPRFNHATKGLYEMGSVFKPFTIAAALEFNKTSLSRWYDVRKPIEVSRFTIKDYHPIKEPVQVRHILEESSNIGTVQIANALSTEEHRSFLNLLGLFEPINGLEMPETSSPILPSQWGETERATVSYGHGIAVTPLHVVTAFSQLVNGGHKIFPTLVKNKAVKSHIRLFSEKTSQDMRGLLAGVVTDGTGKNANAIGYHVGGKTGTAEKPSRRGYAEHRLVSSFIGAFPMDKPRYSVFVLLDEPKATKDTYGYATAGWVAAPVAKDIIMRIAPLLGLKPDVNNGVLQPKIGI